MGIFSFLSGGGNFGFIARNIAAIYTAIGSCAPGKTLTKKQQLFATALVDLMNYFMEGSISIEEVEQELQRIDNDYLVYYPDRGVTPKVISLDSLKDYPYYSVVHLVMILEKMIFMVDTKQSEEVIVTQFVPFQHFLNSFLARHIPAFTKLTTIDYSELHIIQFIIPASAETLSILFINGIVNGFVSAHKLVADKEELSLLLYSRETQFMFFHLFFLFAGVSLCID